MLLSLRKSSDDVDVLFFSFAVPPYFFCWKAEFVKKEAVAFSPKAS